MALAPRMQRGEALEAQRGAELQQYLATLSPADQERFIAMGGLERFGRGVAEGVETFGRGLGGLLGVVDPRSQPELDELEMLRRTDTGGAVGFGEMVGESLPLLPLAGVGGGATQAGLGAAEGGIVAAGSGANPLVGTLMGAVPVPAPKQYSRQLADPVTIEEIDYSGALPTAMDVVAGVQQHPRMSVSEAAQRADRAEREERTRIAGELDARITQASQTMLPRNAISIVTNLSNPNLAPDAKTLREAQVVRNVLESQRIINARGDLIGTMTEEQVEDISNNIPQGTFKDMLDESIASYKEATVGDDRKFLEALASDQFTKTPLVQDLMSGEVETSAIFSRKYKADDVEALSEQLGPQSSGINTLRNDVLADLLQKSIAKDGGISRFKLKAHLRKMDDRKLRAIFSPEQLAALRGDI